MSPRPLAAATLLILASLHPARASVEITRDPSHLTLTWQSDRHPYSATLDLDPNKPLLSALTVGSTPIATNVDLAYRITTGARVRRNVPYVFFDYPISAKNGPVNRYTSRPSRTNITTELSPSHDRAAVTLPGMTAGPFTGTLTLRVYDNSPFLHLDAALTPSADNLAYAYEPELHGDFPTTSYLDPTNTLHTEPTPAADAPIKVKYRTIAAQTPTGTLALFPPPHAFIFPRDFSTNFGFARSGPNTIALRQDLSGGNRFVPWADAPKGRPQHMSAFLLFTPDPAQATLDRVKRYTHADTFVPLADHVTFISHLHPELTVAEMSGHPAAPAFKVALTAAGVNIVHLAEFHLKGHPFDLGETRLRELRAMFDMCARYSDDRFLMIPGEEANTYLPGHWIYLFPHPIYLTLKPTPDRPPQEDIPPFGTVYHPQDETQIMQLIEQQGGLAWTTHPRIKGSERCPDIYKDRPWFQSPTWLGATWKAMPADLSQDRLGTRSLDLLDEMNTWPGRPKFMPSEIDTFDLDPSHEFYGHASVNYLHLPHVPQGTDYTPVIKSLRQGDFFTTTGEILIRRATRDGDHITLDASWTFPLSHAYLTTYDGHQLRRQRFDLPRPEMAHDQLRLPLPPGKTEWWRIDLWDIALNGAYTQPTFRD